MAAETRQQQLNAALKAALLRHLPRAGVITTAVPQLRIGRYNLSRQMPGCFSRPLLGVIVQGTKQGVIGADNYTYREGQCLVAGVDVPNFFQILDVTETRPFLAISLALDRSLLAQLVAKMPPLPGQSGPPVRGISVEETTAELSDALLRLLALLDTPKQIDILAPMILREIHYRLLIGPQGRYLRRLGTHDSHAARIAGAIAWLREHYREPFQVEVLALRAHMAISTFHRHFKAITGLSPLQFHKQLRLYEAQRLMLTGEENATSAGFAVGYESSTQFNREYKRLFGRPPRRDITELREIVNEEPSLRETEALPSSHPLPPGGLGQGL